MAPALAFVFAIASEQRRLVGCCPRDQRRVDQQTCEGPIVFEMNDWLHPEDRAELTDGRAVERLRKDDIDIAS
jgi:hypothetical protein